LKTLYFGFVKKQIILKKGEEHRILAGHLWVFSNEVASLEGDPEAGDIVELIRHDRKPLGLGFYHPHSLIAFRLLTTEPEDISFEFFEKRIQRALALRKRLYPHSETYRLVFGESDFLPGLVVDKYNEFLSIQVLSAGMERRTTLICDVLESLFHPKAIVARNDAPVRTLEQLPLEKKVLRGSPGFTIIDDGCVKFEIDILQGQKTGFFLDQRENRRSLHRYVRDAKVLDCFCYEGGFSLHAAYAKAQCAVGVDSSESAIAKAKVNVRLNDANSVQLETGDVFEHLKKLAEGKKNFQAVILDPPSFTRSKKNIPSALRAYQGLNAAAMRLIDSGGFLATASCSHHITEEGFLSAIAQAARKVKRHLQLLECAGAAPDHPVNPAMAETKYLKFAIFSVH
jgi:23S rRNA (cytosine1962-C5)-methyltransferase